MISSNSYEIILHNVQELRNDDDNRTRCLDAFNIPVENDLCK
ncbi:hypothetical protein PAECIP111893_03560 [Paenibacillus plantiphilus]|uniref:Uncharacterized protein n=1 Tax=Paenibacillus plantiphilus TaxID=2905650 RepID=A0ABN8GPL3_9BACL|nr:hypothetical protein PAECIP111893_03560 [Paenibacillus plantiphilus]